MCGVDLHSFISFIIYHLNIYSSILVTVNTRRAKEVRGEVEVLRIRTKRTLRGSKPKNVE